MIKNNYNWKEIEPKLSGLWENALLALTGISRDCFNRRHQPCPSCGGVDRFRWTNNFINEKNGESGDGGAICNVCGNGSGMTWLMKLTGMNFVTAVNELGRFVNAIPVKQREMIKKESKFACKARTRAEISAEQVITFMEKCRLVDKMPYQLAMGIAPDLLYCFDKIDAISGKISESRIIVPINKVSKCPRQGCNPDLTPCNIAIIDDGGDVIYAAGRNKQQKGLSTLGAVSVIGANTGKAIYLCVGWADAWHVHHATKAQVWCCWDNKNFSYIGNKFMSECLSDKIRAACNVSYDELDIADSIHCQVILPDGDDTISKAKIFYKSLFDPGKVLNDVFNC